MDSAKWRVDSRRAGNCNGNREDKNNMIFEQIMLRFRPIAPLPEIAPSSSGLLPEKEYKRTRVKRKYVRVKKTKNNNNNINNNNNNIASNLTVNASKNWFGFNQTVAMIEDSSEVVATVTDPLQQVSRWISFNRLDSSSSKREEKIMKNDNNNMFISEPLEKKKFLSDLHEVDLATAVQRRKVVESWITVESVTGTCEDRRLLGYTDDEIWKNLERDSCPGFVSNGYDEVQWVNPSYRSLLDPSSNGDSSETEVAVWLNIKVEKSTIVKYLPAYSCRVRIEYKLLEKKRRMTVPCDVCQMDSGGFAWRLDLKFALSLGPASN